MMGKRITITRGALAGVFVAYLMCVVALGAVWHLSHKQNREIAANKRAISYICTTNTVLDKLVVAAGQQIGQNFKDHTYAQLLARGIITQQNIDAAETSLREYKTSHQQLLHNGACRDLSR